jgi:hypothetical protein
MNRTTLEANKSKDEKFKVFCATCKRETNHLVMQSVDESGSERFQCGPDPEDFDYVDWKSSHQIIQCQGCDTFSFRRVQWHSEEDWHDGDGTSTTLYPPRDGTTLIAKEFHSVPRNLKLIYGEIIICFNAGASTLCAAGLRAAIEGLCVAQGVEKGTVTKQKPDGTLTTSTSNNLEGKIAGLHEKGLLTKRNAEILHEHRFLGNQAVHDLSRPSDDDLRTAIEIVEHVFEALYEIPEKGDVLRTKRTKQLALSKPGAGAT